MSKHTPGPWGFSPATPPPNIQINGADGSIVASLFSGEVNARLIAASPDLLSACETLDSLDCCVGYSFPESDWPKFWDALDKARAAIARAKGE